jgi:hypothetical protein
MKRSLTVLSGKQDAIWLCDECLDKLDYRIIESVIDIDSDEYEDGCSECGKTTEDGINAETGFMPST